MVVSRGPRQLILELGSHPGAGMDLVGQLAELAPLEVSAPASQHWSEQCKGRAYPAVRDSAAVEIEAVNPPAYAKLHFVHAFIPMTPADEMFFPNLWAAGLLQAVPGRKRSNVLG